MRSVNDKIRWTSHSSFVYVGASHVRGLRTIKYDGQAIQVLYTSERRMCADCER